MEAGLREQEEAADEAADRGHGAAALHGSAASTPSRSRRSREAADVAEKTVFNYFPTKEDLVYGRLESFEEELLEAVRERAPGESVAAAFMRFVRCFFRSLTPFHGEMVQ